MLKSSFRYVPFGTEKAFMPFTWVSVVRGGSESVVVDALFDSGAACNLISLANAPFLLGMPVDEARKGKILNIYGIGATTKAFGWKVDLKLRSSSTSTDTMTIPDVWLYAVDGPIPVQHMLIGQIGGLEGRIFVHMNRPSSRYWIFKNPSIQSPASPTA